MTALTVIRAGAGSGKTHRICEEIAAAVVDGVDPARILATTFTRKAAAELKGRAQARVRRETRLPYSERLRRAERLELALVGTVHSVGHRLVRRFALPLGLSPQLDILEEEGGRRRLRRLLGELPEGPWEDLIGPARRLSLDGDLHDRVLRLLEAKRTNAVSDEAFRTQMADSASRVCELLLGTDGRDLVDAPSAELRPCANAALEAIGRVHDETQVTQKAIAKLRRLASRPTSAWSDYLEAARLQAGRRSGANDCLSDLRALGATVRTNASLHADVRGFLAALTERVIALQGIYAAYKRERGLLDFNDLELHFLHLLEDEQLAGSLAREIELVVVDEFQDTNPVQLAIFLGLRNLARRSVWVGDPKQAIYGFRGADARLASDAWSAVEGCETDDLPKNYRSTAGLVRTIGDLFAPVFDDEACLEPVRPASGVEIERWLLNTRNKQQDDAALAQGIAALIGEATPAADVAILVRTNEHAQGVAKTLVHAGIPALVERPGLLGTRECALVLAGLCLVADRFDSLAAATTLHLLDDPTTQTPAWLEPRLREVRAAKEEEAGQEANDHRPRRLPWAGNPALAALEAVDPRGADPISTLEAVLGALGLGTLIARWGEPDRRAANLDALIDLAHAYKDEADEQGRACTLTGLIAWLEALPDAKEDMFPVPRGLDAVIVRTYHGAKGLEWPVVVLTDLDWGREPDMWQVAAEGGHAAEGRPLEGRTLRYWPWPFGRSFYGRLNTGSHLETDALATEEGMGARADAEAEALRLLYVGMTRARDRLVLAHRADSCAWLEKLPAFPALIGTHQASGTCAIGDTGATLRVRTLESEEAEEEAEREEHVTWMTPPTSGEVDAAPRYAAASRAAPVDPAPTLETEALPGPHPFPASVRTEDWDALGCAVHTYLAALPSLRTVAGDERRVVAERCLRGHRAEGVLTPQALLQAGERMETWVQGRWPEARWRVEVPVSGPRNDGGTWRGIVDLLLLLPDGGAVLVDHKTAPLPEPLWTDKAAESTGQLAAYAEALASAGIDVREQWIHLPLGGGAVRIGTSGSSVV